MDIEATMKVNTLAKELVEKGIAANSEEASVLAEDMMQKQVIPREGSVKTDVNERYEILLERATRKLSQGMESLNENMKSIVKQMDEIRKDIQHIKRKQVQPEQKKVVTEAKETQKKIEPKNKQEFTSEDVAIDKIFYFGKKG